MDVIDKLYQIEYQNIILTERIIELEKQQHLMESQINKLQHHQCKKHHHTKHTKLNSLDT